MTSFIGIKENVEGNLGNPLQWWAAMIENLSVKAMR
jgi:hypothetical protein